MTNEQLLWVQLKIEDYIENADEAELTENDKRIAKAILEELGSSYKSQKLIN